MKSDRCDHLLLLGLLFVAAGCGGYASPSGSGGDDDDTVLNGDDDDADVLAVGANVQCWMDNEVVPWVSTVMVFEENTQDRIVSMTSGDDGNACFEGLEQGRRYRIEVHDAGTQECVLAGYFTAELSETLVVDGCPCSGECPGSIGLGNCNPVGTTGTPMDDCWWP